MGNWLTFPWIVAKETSYVLWFEPTFYLYHCWKLLISQGSDDIREVDKKYSPEIMFWLREKVCLIKSLGK